MEASKLDMWLVRDSGLRLSPAKGVPGKFQMRSDEEVKSALSKVFQSYGLDPQTSIKLIARAGVDYPYGTARLQITLRGEGSDFFMACQAIDEL